MKTEQAHHHDKGTPSTISVIGSMLTHLLLLLPVLYIVGLAFQAYNFFAWHPICMALGAGLILIEGVYTISGEAYVSKKVARKTRVTLHWVVHLVGLALLIAGLTITIINKDNNNWPHFQSTHGQLGLATFIIVWIIACFGILANNAHWLYPKVRPVLLKVVHSYAGICMTILLLATVINGTYNNWWTKPISEGGAEAGETGRNLVFASLFFAGLFVLIKPIIGAVARTKVLMRPPPAAQTPSSST